LRMERDLVHWCFEPAWRDAHSDTVEGIRALAIDKDHAPRWQPASVDALQQVDVLRMFVSPWAPDAHPLAAL
jgi:Enoyl-CoA hydratase/isomerase